MASTSTYLNFRGKTEEAFNFYKSIFGGEFFGNGPMRYGDVPQHPDAPPMSEAEKNLIMHVELKITGGHSIMATDMPDRMRLKLGNNVHLNLQPDTRAETDRLFATLSEGGSITMPLQEMFWGDYFGSCIDKFGTCWMFNCDEKG